jgi:hypothetical protein
LAIGSIFLSYSIDMPYIYTQHSLHNTDSITDNLISSLYCLLKEFIINKTICVSKAV